jgi:hypothetical protein
VPTHTSEREFWPTAWALMNVLLEGPERAITSTQEELIHLLHADYAVQAFIFNHRRFQDQTWFPYFVRFGLFADPPPILQTPQGLFARPWPSLEYLRAQVSSAPSAVARILSRIESPNWWVIAESLSIASSLPTRYCTQPLLDLLRLWESAPVQWTGGDGLARVLTRLSESSEGRRHLASETTRMIDTLVGQQGSGYELSRMLEGAREGLRRYSLSAFCDGLETAMIPLLSSPTHSVLLSADLEDLDRSWRQNDPLSVLSVVWYRVVEEEVRDFGGAAVAVRAARLLEMQSLALRRMGVRALDLALSDAPDERIATRRLAKLVADESFLSDWREAPAFLRLLKNHASHIPVDALESVLAQANGWANADDRTVRYRAFNVLDSLAAVLGPTERLKAQDLENEFGTVRQPLLDASAAFVGPRSPLSLETVESMTVGDLLPWMRHVPVDSAEPGFPASPEGLSRVLQEDVPRRPVEYLDIMSEVIDTVPYASILVGILRGFEASIKSAEAREPIDPTRLIQFLVSASERTSSTYRPEEMHSHPESLVRGGAMDVIQAAASWFVEMVDSLRLTSLLRLGLEDSDPTPGHEAEFGGSNMDPPTLALNSTRGKSVRALLDCLSATWTDADRTSLKTELDALMLGAADLEESPSVRSPFGIYLPWLMRNWPREAPGPLETLLPLSPESQAQWEAVFGTYILLRPAYVDVAEELAPHYELAIEMMDAHPSRFLTQHQDRLLVHLIVILLRSDNAQTWKDRAVRAIASASDDAAGTALNRIADAASRGELELHGDAVRSLIDTSVIEAMTSETKKLGGLADVLMAAGGPISTTGTYMLDLLQRGAATDLDDVLRYLATSDESASVVGARVLLESVRVALEREPWFTDEGDLVEGVERYSTAGRQSEMRELVNLLGRSGRFFVEEQAARLYAEAEPARD